MITVRLIGGLGNQMFQYAAGRCLAHKNKTGLRLDITDLLKLKTRKFGLDCFNIKGVVTTKSKLKRIIAHFFPLKKQNIYSEKHYQFDPKFLKIGDNITLVGYFQSEKYFSDIKDVISKDFNFKYLPKEKNLKILKQIKSQESVSIHIRRGDYVSNKDFLKYHGICTIDYYKSAVSLIAHKVKKPSFYVFSDHMAWAKENLKINYPVLYIDFNEGVDHEDLRLMSSCKHNIIANSSFSWWGAWLNKNKNKLVITPKNWFNEPSIKTYDLIPSTWIIL